MIKSTKTWSNCLVVAMVCGCLFGCNGEEETVSQDLNIETSAVSYVQPKLDCECDADWFPHSDTPAPAEGKSPSMVTIISPCAKSIPAAIAGV